jgi:hypothetical protein
MTHTATPTYNREQHGSITPTAHRRHCKTRRDIGRASQKQEALRTIKQSQVLNCHQVKWYSIKPLKPQQHASWMVTKAY